MTLSADTRQLLLAYNSFTDFAGGPDLPWVVEIYEGLEDDTVRHMIWALCYAWAAGQRAAGCFEESVETLAQALFFKLPIWEDTWSQDSKAAWLNELGIQMIMPEPEPRPTGNKYPAKWNDLDSIDRNAVEDMAEYFQLGLPETLLLYSMGRALKQSSPTPTVRFQLAAPGQHNGH